MKVIKIAAFVLALCLLLVGCKAEAVSFQVGQYDLAIIADSTFEDVTAGDWNLQISDGNVYISIMAWKYSEMADDNFSNSYELYTLHDENLKSKRQNVETIAAEITYNDGERKAYRNAFRAEKDGLENVYYTYLLDFEESGRVAWVILNGEPSYFEENLYALETIVNSIYVTSSAV